jgi:hypothetical protein
MASIGIANMIVYAAGRREIASVWLLASGLADGTANCDESDVLKSVMFRWQESFY